MAMSANTDKRNKTTFGIDPKHVDIARYTTANFRETAPEPSFQDCRRCARTDEFRINDGSHRRELFDPDVLQNMTTFPGSRHSSRSPRNQFESSVYLDSGTHRNFQNAQSPSPRIFVYSENIPDWYVKASITAVNNITGPQIPGILP
jgi:hypothetical protein